eukprot:UN03681
MRQRGTQKGLTDLSVLIVAATDGVQPMTKESAQLIKENGVPLVVAVNKCDVQGAMPEKALKQLYRECDINTTGIGGDVPSVEISALKKMGLDDLLEQIALLATDKDIYFKPRQEFNDATVQSWNKQARSIAKGDPISLHVLGDDGFEILKDVTEVEDMALGYAFVVESKQQPGGAHIDVIVRQGSLKVGDHVVC